MGPHHQTNRPKLEWEMRQGRWVGEPTPAYDVIDLRSIGGRAHIVDDFSAGKAGRGQKAPDGKESNKKVLLLDIDNAGGVSIFKITV